MNGKLLKIIVFWSGTLLLSCFFGIVLFMDETKGSNDIEIWFSKESGFYDSDFELEIGATSGTIYYTLDSSDPDESSLIYSEPILIQDASLNPNVYSMIPDSSVFLLYNNEMENLGIQNRYPYSIPESTIDKATIVRAMAIDDKGNKSEVETKIFFVNFNNKSGYSNMNILSVVSDPVNLFDYDTGIYIAGKRFDELLGDRAPEISDFFHTTYGANYNMRGEEWERPAFLTFFDSDKNEIFNETCGMRIQGSSSRNLLPKSLNLFLRDEYNCNDSFPGNTLFDLVFELNRINLYNCSNDSYRMLSDYLVNNNTEDLSVLTRPMKPYILFLDGEYWGTYFLQPNYDSNYISNIYDVYEENIICYKLNHISIGKPNDDLLYQEMYTYITEHDMKNPLEYEMACNMIDIQSYIDYCSLNIYISNWDWPDNNFMLWRTRYNSSGEYSDCKWRWIVWDVNAALSVDQAEVDYVQWAYERDAMFASLLENEEFRNSLYERLVFLAENNFNPDEMNTFIDEFESSREEAMDKHYSRFYSDNLDVQYFRDSCDDTKTFFLLRYQYIIDNYKNNED